MPFKGIDWKIEIHKAVEYGKRGWSLQDIGDKYGISRQRVKQVFQQYGIDPAEIGVKVRTKRRRDQKAKEHFEKWGDQNQELYEEKRQKYRQKKHNTKRQGIPFTIKFSELEFPTHCPFLGIELNYFAEGREDASISFDRIDPSKGYEAGNVIVCSWRANRIKSDATPEELRRIADYLDSFNRSQ